LSNEIELNLNPGRIPRLPTPPFVLIISIPEKRMKKILFVDDNELLLELYGVMLADEQDRWQTTLAPNGTAALKLIQQTAFDVVVSDMQMPGMNGIELLTELCKLHPQTSRIIVSGLADQAEAAESLNCTHLFIPKPFDAKTLHATLGRIGSLDAYLKNDALRGLAGQMHSLPSFPTLYLEILREIESPHSSVQAIASIVAQDPGITAKVLQVANSAAIGLPRKVSDAAEAVQQLGATTVRSLVLSAQVFRTFAPAHMQDFSADALWAHLMRCGALARAILRREHAPITDAEDAFTAGMLHDMGKLMLADSRPKEFAEALEVAAEERISLAAAEQKVFGADHAGLAAYLLGLWGLPTSIVEAVAFHHTPEQSGLKQCSALTAVHVANAFLDETGTAPVNLEYLAEIGVAGRLAAWQETAVALRLQEA
jgi:HD-like signal output (HDOD) protein/ActR/RegA family two-component response regulator